MFRPFWVGFPTCSLPFWDDYSAGTGRELICPDDWNIGRIEMMSGLSVKALPRIDQTIMVPKHHGILT